MAAPTAGLHFTPALMAALAEAEDVAPVAYPWGGGSAHLQRGRLGPHAVVLKPADLVARMRENVRDMTVLYQDARKPNVT